MLDDPAPCDFATDEDVLRNAEIRKQFEFLKNDPNPGLRGLARGLELHGNSVEQNSAGSRLLRASQNLHQGRLAGSIFANQHIDRALVHGEIDLIERQRARDNAW